MAPNNLFELLFLHLQLFVMQTLVTDEEASIGTAANDAGSVSAPKSTASFQLEPFSLTDLDTVTGDIHAIGVPDVEDRYRIARSGTTEDEDPGVHSNDVLNLFRFLVCSCAWVLLSKIC